VLSIRIVISRLARRSRIGADRVRVWSSFALGNGVATSKSGPSRVWPEMDIDLIPPDIDTVDQGGQQGTLSCSGQFGPALADFRGARDEPVLR
jgi:hypothetical protein